jgi:carbon storage regulator CsrA
MLVLTRQAGQWLRIGADVRVQVVHARHGRVLLGVEAPRAVAVLREELVAGEPQPQREKENQKERDQDLRTRTRVPSLPTPNSKSKNRASSTSSNSNSREARAPSALEGSRA